MHIDFPEPYLSHYETMRIAIQQRLQEFTQIPQTEWFYEACYCILTPQSKAVHADAVVHALQSKDFWTYGFDTTSLLRNPETYIRFHNQKNKNLLALREGFQEIENTITQYRDTPLTLRDILTKQIRGFGMKEAAHFMRNIGIFGPTILDRHILKHLAQCGIRSAKKPMTTKAHYLQIEKAWLRYCKKVDIPMEEMDLVFWSMETGIILK